VQHRGVLIAMAVAAAIAVAAASAQINTDQGRAASSPPREPLSVYGRTLWNLEALLHDTFGRRTTCIRWSDYALVSASCGDLAHYGYWQDIFVAARHSSFKLVRRAHPPAMGNVRVVTMNGRYVSCGTLPGWGALAHEGSATVRWLVVVHGWAMTPFMCAGQ
jgi:hypothetical protein